MNVMKNAVLMKATVVTARLAGFGPGTDVYFSADIETDGPIPGPYSMLSFALVYAGAFDGSTFYKPADYGEHFYAELQPISNQFEAEAIRVNGLDRAALARDGLTPREAMTSAARWIRRIAGASEPVFVAYPLSFDWSWLYWYFVQFSDEPSPFGYSKCFDMKTAIAVKLGRTIASSGRQKLPPSLAPASSHTHHALDDAVAQAEIFAKLFTTEFPLAQQLP
jgi:DNA polymerase III epsilon subunit-like protein